MKHLMAFVDGYLKKEWVVLMLVVLASILAFRTLFFSGYFPHHDDLQVMRIVELEKCFADGQIPCRWVPDMGYGYGYPLFNYYPPFPSYLGVFIRFLLPIQVIDTVKISFMLQIIVGAVLMYLFAKQWWGRVGGFVSSVFYTFAPYHALDLYVRGALNEAWAMSFAPGVGWAMTRLYRKITCNNIVLMAACFAGMLLSHNLMVIIFTPLFLLYGLLLAAFSRSVKLLMSFAAGGILAILIAAFFSVPVIVEGKFVHLETLFYGYFNFTVHFVTLDQLFISRFWGWGASVYGTADGMAFPIGWLHWGAVLVSMLALLYFFLKRNYKLTLVIGLFIGYFWVSAFLTHEQSHPIWVKVPLLQTLQFPWRILSTVALCASFLVGALFVLPQTKLIRNTLLIGLVFSVIYINIEFFRIEYPMRIKDQTMLAGYRWESQRTAGIFDYLPKTAVRPPGRPAPGDYQLLAGDAIVTDIRKGSASLTFTTQAATPSVIRLNIFDFPTWRVWVDGNQVPIRSDNYMGLITFTVPQGRHQVTAKLTNTPVRTLANFTSLITMLALLVWYARLGYLKWQAKSNAV